MEVILADGECPWTRPLSWVSGENAACYDRGDATIVIPDDLANGSGQ
jgi:hypothetical protein